MPKPKVYNHYHQNAPRGTVNVGRPSKFGNPFIVGVHGSRNEVVDMYEQWLDRPAQTDLREAVKRELKGKNLLCFCAPKKCHADILLRIANEEEGR